ncbi:MAG: ankyrin repeat domain-containing protein [Armatimonadota bacterium]
MSDVFAAPSSGEIPSRQHTAAEIIYHRHRLAWRWLGLFTALIGIVIWVVCICWWSLFHEKIIKGTLLPFTLDLVEFSTTVCLLFLLQFIYAGLYATARLQKQYTPVSFRDLLFTEANLIPSLLEWEQRFTLLLSSGAQHLQDVFQRIRRYTPRLLRLDRRLFTLLLVGYPLLSLAKLLLDWAGDNAIWAPVASIKLLLTTGYWIIILWESGFTFFAFPYVLHGHTVSQCHHAMRDGLLAISLHNVWKKTKATIRFIINPILIRTIILLFLVNVQWLYDLSPNILSFITPPWDFFGLLFFAQLLDRFTAPELVCGCVMLSMCSYLPSLARRQAVFAWQLPVETTAPAVASVKKMGVIRHRCILAVSIISMMLIAMDAVISGIAYSQQRLHYAAAAGDVHKVERLLATGYKVNGTNTHHPYQFTLSIGLTRFPSNSSGRLDYFSPLEVASGAGKVEVVKLLLTRGATVNPDDWFTPLILAIQNNHLSVAKELLSHGAIVNPSSGMLPLHHANTQEMIALLLAYNAKVDQKDDEGNTRLHQTAKQGEVQIASLLIAHHADVNAQNNNYKTPLHLAASEGKSGVVNLLLAHGAKVNVKDEDGHTPYHVAFNAGAPAKVLNTLRRHGGKY